MLIFNAVNIELYVRETLKSHDDTSVYKEMALPSGSNLTVWNDH